MNTEYNAIRVVASLEQIQSTVNSYVWGVSALCAGVLLLLVVTGLLGKKLFPGQKNATSSKKNGEQK